MKKKIFSLILVVTLIVSAAIPFVTADVALSARFDQTGHYGIVSDGIGLNGLTGGDITLTVPGSVVAAYLYWAGIDNIGAGDDTITFEGNTLTADEQYGPEDWYGSLYTYVYIEDVTNLISSGDNTYTISDFTIPSASGTKNYGAGLVVVYEDSAIPITRIMLMDGSDGFWFGWTTPLGPNSDTACFNFDPIADNREADLLLIVAGTEHSNRPNEVWTDTGSGSTPLNIITSPSAAGGSYPLAGNDGNAWDTYTDKVAVNVGETWLCSQVESIVSWENAPDPQLNGRGTSAVMIAAAIAIPVCYDFEGLTPGFWKNHPDVWAGYSTEKKFSEVFGIEITIQLNGKTTVTDPTLLQALNAAGGVNEAKNEYDALARHAVAALLNSAHPAVEYPLTTQQIIDAVHDAIQNANNAAELKDMLDAYNNLGGGIDAHGNPI